jgi:primase-polymerase (primpol)-like protein
MSASVRAIAPKIRAVEVPEELRMVPGWLIWRLEQYPGEDKARKVPYWTDGTIRHGQQGSPTDRARLTTFVAARDAAARMGYAGVGFAPLPDFGYTFLDFDHCVGPERQIPAEIEKIVVRTYAEYSPSGLGIRAALKGNLGNHKSPSGPNQFGFETFSSSGFVTFTGNILAACELIGLENTVAEIDQHVLELCERRFGGSIVNNVADPEDFMAGREPKLGLTVERMAELVNSLDPNMGRDEWIRVGMALHHECDGDDTGFELWDE